ncbi:hypothetical protein OROGR_012038 [Orobanche gracilis]
MPFPCFPMYHKKMPFPPKFWTFTIPHLIFPHVMRRVYRNPIGARILTNQLQMLERSVINGVLTSLTSFR